ncbi:MAG: sugar transferase [Capsulimonadaceae bacterium]
MSLAKYGMTETEDRITLQRFRPAELPPVVDTFEWRMPADRTLCDNLVSILENHGFKFLLFQDSEPLHLRPAQHVQAYNIFKRIVDIVLSVAALLVLFLPILAISVAIYLEDGGPVVYSQWRTGRHGRDFRFYKFRSMVKNADEVKAQLQAQNEASGPIFKIKNDPRVTRIGRFIRRTSLDELPQFLNVLRGEMSIIGPRPLYSPEADKLNRRHSQRHNVQPGLFCLREVCGRSELTFDQWMELDLIYVGTRSTRTDLTVLLRAIPKILRAHGAY